MSVYWDTSKKRWRIEITRGGIRVRKLAPRGATKEDAEAFEANVVLGAFREELGKKREYTLEEAFAKWAKEELPAMKSAVATSSHATALLPYLKGRKLSDVADVAEAYKKANKKLKPATIYQRLALLRRVANLAFKKWDWLDTPLGEKIRMPKVNNTRHVYLTYEQLLMFLIAARSQAVEDAILIGMYTGLRAGEITRLTPDNVRGDFITLGIDTKSGKPRSVPIHPAIRDALDRLPLGITVSGISQGFAKLADDLGLPDVHFHDATRHTFASWLVQGGVGIYDVAHLLGHASVKTTQRYAHLSPEHLRDVLQRSGLVGR